MEPFNLLFIVRMCHFEAESVLPSSWCQYNSQGLPGANEVSPKDIYTVFLLYLVVICLIDEGQVPAYLAF
jgi:hypothetical protein